MVQATTTGKEVAPSGLKDDTTVIINRQLLKDTKEEQKREKRVAAAEDPVTNIQDCFSFV
jgi:hypothetical protein